ncbi:NAD(P)/FAD-dependent oxidoreductase [Acinetobacter baumannii]|uniref:NAD(P)/FAD-dependent oxidoreductase n=1 Tax=Acinetobacter baumannii TaxID=470 RepID=UPI002340E383|nr:FAD-dependent oxidoreductase [Acinetobacter baumannii]
MEYGLIIIGAGQAAAQCAVKTRDKGFNGNILVIGAETYLPYQRPPLSKKYLSGELGYEELLVYPESLYQSKNIEFKLNSKVRKIVAEENIIEIENGEQLKYHHLVIATGSRPNQLPKSVLPKLDNVFAFRGIDDCHAIQQFFQPEHHLVILGGGYIGLELAAVAKNKGLYVTLLEKSRRILQRVACEETSTYIRNVHQDKGVQILENANVEAFVSNAGKLERVILDNGQELPADLMVVGIGVTANYDIAEACGIEIKNRAIFVDEQCRTNISNIYAIGDCTCFNLNGQLTRLESVQNANEQAEVVASVINQQNTTYNPVPWFWSDQFNLKLQISGLGRDYNKVFSRVDTNKGSASFWYFQDNILKAVDAINDPRAFMFSKRFLDKNIDNTDLIANVNLDLKEILC